MIYLDCESYDQELQEKYFNKVKELYIKDSTSGKICELMRSCKKILGRDNFNDYFHSSSPEENFKELILMHPKRIEGIVAIIKNRIVSEESLKKKFEDRSIQRLKKVYKQSKLMQKKIDGQKINISLTNALGITVCPYCNRNFINNRKESSGSDMDHFYNKDTYPIFAVSLYNLVPSCSVCNRIKHTKELRINPFIRRAILKNEVNFNYSFKSLTSMEVTLNSSEAREKDLNQLNLKEAYQIHQQDIKSMLEREERYSEGYREELRELFKDSVVDEQDSIYKNVLMNITDDEIDQVIYGDVIFSENIKNIPLGKFKKDIYQDIKSMRDF